MCSMSRVWGPFSNTPYVILTHVYSIHIYLSVSEAMVALWSRSVVY